jgi:hypothetical protein
MSEFNFEFHNSFVPIKPVEGLDFRPYGKIIGVDISQEEVELNEHLLAAQITEVPKLYDFVVFGNFELIPVKIPIGDVQKIIKMEINRLLPKFNKLAQEEKNTNENTCKKIVFSQVLERPNLIEFIQYKNINPFEWYVQLGHRNPPQTPGLRDDIYHFMLRDKELYLNMGIRIYYTDKDEEKIYHISVSRSSGRSPAIRDFYRNLKDVLGRAEKIHNLLKEKR